MREPEDGERTCILREVDECQDYQKYQDFVGAPVIWRFSDKEELHMAVLDSVSYKERKITLHARREKLTAEFGRVKIYVVAE